MGFEPTTFCPLLEPLPGTLPEAEIWARLVRSLGLVDEAELAPLREAELAPLREAAEESRQAYTEAFAKATTANPVPSKLAPYVLYETLAPTLPQGLESVAASGASRTGAR